MAGLLLFASPWEASAQGEERGCGDFSFRRNDPEAQREVPPAQLEKAAQQGCDINATFAIITDDLNLRGIVFEGATDFRGTIFRGYVDFEQATFWRDASFIEARFAGYANFKGANFRDNAIFVKAKFELIADFHRAIIDGIILFNEAEFEGEVWPPIHTGRGTDLTWNMVRDTLPTNRALTDNYSAWENFLTSGGQFTEAREVRTARHRHALRPLLYLVIASFLLLVFLFAGMYYPFFRHARRSSRPFHTGKVLLFSLDAISSQISPWKYDWKGHGGLPVERVALLTAIESALGWSLLSLTSALIVAWLIV